MRRRLRLSLASSALLFGDSMVYELRPASGSRFALTVEKTGLLSGKKHLSLLERYKGILFYDPESPERSRVELAIDAARAVCKGTWVSEKDLKKIQNYARRPDGGAARKLAELSAPANRGNRERMRP